MLQFSDNAADPGAVPDKDLPCDPVIDFGQSSGIFSKAIFFGADAFLKDPADVFFGKR